MRSGCNLPSLAEAALRRILAPSRGAGRARLARMDGSTETPRDPSPAPRTDMQSPLRRSRAVGTVRRAPRLRRSVLQGDSAQATGQNFVGPLHYFGNNEDAGRRSKNQAEMRRRREGGSCFKCRMSDIKDVPFLERPLHGALATAPTAATVGRTRCTPKRA